MVFILSNSHLFVSVMLTNLTSDFLRSLKSSSPFLPKTAPGVSSPVSFDEKYSSKLSSSSSVKKPSQNTNG
jgi:hypothetical protein